jgi:hypothetical protein
MKINESILKNEKLASEMRSFSTEIERLEQLRDLLESRNQSVNHELIIGANRYLRSAKKQFAMLNDSFQNIPTEGLVPGLTNEINEEMKRLDEFFMRLNISIR